VICVLQFDAASVAVVDRMLAAGQLPVLAGLQATGGGRVDLETPAVDFAAGAFHTLYSGVEIGDHGLFYPFQFDAAEQRVRYATAFDAPPAVWELLAREGRRSLVLDPYESRPPRVWSGAHACGVGFRDRVVLPRWSRPRRIGRIAGAGPHATEIFGRPTAGELLRLRRKLLDAPGRLARAAERLLAAERFDLAWVTFPAAHLAGHQYWDLSQLAAGPNERERILLEGALADVYAAVDAAMGRIIAALPEGADVIVTSAVGMDVNTSRADLLPGMLAAVLAGRPLPDGASGAIWRLRAGVPPRARRAVAAALPDRVALELTSRLELRGIDFATTPAFAHPADNQGYVRLNLAGRERDGIVGEAEARAVTDSIREGLASFRDPDGSPAVASVVRVAELYPGERSERLPDLVVRWSERPATAIDRVVSDDFGEVRRSGAGSGRSGNHTAGDAWAVLAPGEGHRTAARSAARLADVAATIATRLELDAAAGMVGRSLLER
jgi:predicted AlkP superfamily phosphohydrolase/phosphomutase